ncbi:hypothetical protein [Pseudoduganella lutea]|uniref:Uncharacterized protein n=1 Tax=Pseudoduganella lutea TaxID=321985 RepID=A0A4P6KWG0_9BURK|nr:hypothetical protein [Pseudoduganella lutea]QBE62812.1 hypothetical protein EWM63_07405 [Pseudoduganella lutea]
MNLLVWGENKKKPPLLAVCLYLLDSSASRLRAPAFTQPPGGREPKVKKAGKENEAVHGTNPLS